MHHPSILDSQAETPVLPAAGPEAVLRPHLSSAPLGDDIAAAPPRIHAFDPALPPVLVAEDDPDDAYFIDRFVKKTGVKNPMKLFDDGSEVVNFLGSVRRPEAAARHRRRSSFSSIST